MAAYSAHSAAVSPLPSWGTIFAKEVEPDLDFEEDLEDFEDSAAGGYAPKSPRKKSGGRPILWLLIIVLLGAAGYFYMDPDSAMDLMAPLIGESPPPPAVVQPPPKPATNTPQTATGMASPAPGTPAAPPPAVAAIPSPQFSEGQTVSVILDPAAPGGSLSLSADPAGTRPGPKVQPGATLTVVDGELQNNSWVYAVRTQAGETGWIAEKRLVAKP